MKMIFLIGLMVIGGLWGAVQDRVFAVPPPSSTAEGQAITAENFEKAILSALTRQYGRLPHRVQVNILFPKKPLIVPTGTLHLDVEKISGGSRTGRRAFRVGLFLKGQFMKTINVVGELKAQATVTAPIRWIKPREVVIPEDVTTIMVDLPSLTHDFILNQEEVIGKQVLRPLPPRRPIRKTMLDDPPIIHKGDRVTIEVRSGGLLVQAVGLAKAAGKSGDMIPVQNKASGREVIGTILSAGLVEVGF